MGGDKAREGRLASSASGRAAERRISGQTVPKDEREGRLASSASGRAAAERTEREQGNQ